MKFPPDAKLRTGCPSPVPTSLVAGPSPWSVNAVSGAVTAVGQVPAATVMTSPSRTSAMAAATLARSPGTDTGPATETETCTGSESANPSATTSDTT